VTDFGFAQVKTALSNQLTFIAGTPAFMAPEQVDRTWGEIGPQTDIYGLGAVLYFLLTGSPPINGATTNDVLSRLTSESEIQSVKVMRPETPNWLADIISRSLCKNASQRFKSVETLIEALNNGMKS